MMRKLAILCVLLVAFGLVSCTTSSPDTSSEEDMISLDQEGDTGSSDEAAAEESATTESADEGTQSTDDTVAANEESGQVDELDQEIDESNVDESAFDENQETAQAEEPAQPAEEIAQEQPPPPAPVEEPPPPPPVVEEAQPAPEVPAEPAQQLAEITNIKYLANQSGGTVVIETSSPVTYQIRNKPETKQYIVEIPGATLPSRLKRPYILKEFDAAFAAINAYQNPGSTTARIVIQLKDMAGGEPLVQQEGNTLVVLPASPASTMQAVQEPPPTEATPAEGTTPPSGAGGPDAQTVDEQAASADEKTLGARNLDEFLTGTNKFYGNPISVEVNDQDVRDVLNFVAAESGLNLVITDDVQGKITMKLRGIPWDQALITIMQAKKLGYVRQGSVIRISTLGSLQEENNAAKRILDSQKTIAPLRVKVMPISYANVDDLTGKVRAFLTQGRGQAISDNRTSSLILTDTEDVLDRIERLVKELDIPPAQVMIEGKIVEAQDTFSQTLGLNWAMSGAPLVLAPGGGSNGTDVSLNQSLSITNLAAGAVGTGSGALGMTLRIGRFDIIGDINAALSLAESDAMVKILSSPRVVTMNREKASIEQKGQIITIQTLRDAQGQTTRSSSSKDFSLKLQVTPQITAVGSVILDVDVTREFPGSIVDAQSGARPINSRKADTKVLVNDGQTAVIGGIYSADNTTTENGVPWLKDIPVLGWLFKSRIRQDSRNELLIFLTPKILNIKDQEVES